ncbi:MlaD family protein [Nocardia beijingensis]|uniref:MlaD family protein n=1 Tax=Nocardia beijingensis TaxID=95162 RepID=UPI0033BA804A
MNGWRRPRGPRLLFASIVTVLLTACGCGFDPSDHGLPGTGVDGPTYGLAVEFESVLSLPAGARVSSNGADVGRLRSIDLLPHAAVAHIDVRSDVRLPVGTRAELRQNTVLGDIYLALLPPPDNAAGQLRDGDTIPLRDTDTGPQIEQILERMAAFVNGGSAARMQDAVEQLDRALPADPAETRELAGRIATDLGAAADGIGDIDRIVTATEQVTRRLHQMREEVGFLFSETAARRLGRVPEFMTAVLNVVIDVNTLTTGLDWLIPRLPHLNDALERTAVLLRDPSPDAAVWTGNGALLSELLSGKVIPFLGNPALDLRRIGLAGSPDRDVDALILLRLIGVLP